MWNVFVGGGAIALLWLVARHRLRKRLLIEAPYRAFFDSTTDGVICHAADGSVISVNSAAASILGRSLDELTAAKDWSLWTHLIDSTGRVIEPEDISCVIAMREGIHVKDRIVGIRHGQSNALIWLQLESIPIFEAGVKVPSQVIAVFMDATDSRQTEDRFRVIIDASPNALLMVDQAGKIALANQAGEAMFGFNQEELLGQSIDLLVPAANLRDQLLQLRHIPGAPEDIAIGAMGELTGRHKNGQSIPMEIGLRAITTLEGEFTLATIVDVSARRQSQQDIAIAQQRYQALFDQLPDGILLINHDLRVIGHNEEAQQLLRYAPGDLLQLHVADIDAIDDMQEIAARRLRIEASGRDHFESVYRTADNKLLEVDVSVKYVNLVNGERLFQVLFRDISDKNQASRYIEKMAYSDHLTGLANRALLSDRLSQAMVHARRRNAIVGVAFVDLDGFKVINDRHGHQSGDAMLLALAGRMKDALREGDTLARLGGDEFVAVLVDLQDSDACQPLLQRLLDAAAQPVLVGDTTLQVTSSIGVTFYPQGDDVDADQLLRQADQAMYQAKLAGKNRFYYFDADSDRNARGFIAQIERIQQALVQRQFVLHYQPKVNMRTRKLVGVEALIRWLHPTDGLLAPAHFLPFVEDHHLSVDIGDWVLEEALGQVTQWKREGLDIPVSVNISAIQIQQTDFVDRLAEKLRRFELPPYRLELELLESSAMDDLEQAAAIMSRCADMHVGFALDDFGTGHSSLTYLKRLPAPIIKIDQSFVREMLNDEENKAILEGVLWIMRQLRRTVVAEGVETLEHGRALMQLGCELAQGYGIGRPMPAHEMQAWMQRWEKDADWKQIAMVYRSAIDYGS
jgi:diguanylate cyclase (GGDEF)-like protein/PAS domain S-box-containing protein